MHNMTFASITTLIYCYLVYAILVVGALVILLFLLNLSMKLWEKLQDRAIINYRVEQRIRKMRKMRKPLKVEQENKNERD